MIALERLHAQHLVRPLASPAAVVAHLLAVQSQDYYGACWALGQRAKGATAATVDAAFDAGEILRTHVMRPTWHFIAPADARWLLALTAPRVLAATAYWFKQLGLTAAKFTKAETAMASALRGQSLTRDEIGTRIGAKGVELAHYMMHAEAERAVISGPRRGKQFTYALFDERVPPSPALSRDAALAELARRYVTSHGPATIKDLAWWSGLTATDARRALELAAIEPRASDGMFAAPTKKRPALADPTIHLLPNYDECLIAFADRSAAHDPRLPIELDAAVFSKHFVLSNGLLIGGWKRSVEKATTVVAATLLVPATKAERAALANETARLGKFLGTPTRLDL